MIRAYDDGIAFRYVVKNLGNTETVVIQDELTEFNLAEDAKSWWIKAYQPSRYEQLYSSTKISPLVGFRNASYTQQIIQTIYKSTENKKTTINLSSKHSLPRYK